MHNAEPFPPGDFETIAATPAVAEARFTCARHGTEAGTVRLHGSEAGGWMVIVHSFAGEHRERLHTTGAEALQDALPRGDARWIHQMDEEWAPFYCPACGRVYCGACWRTSLVFDPEWKDWLEETRGVCPEGHDRMLSD
jgi:hypothetical protein